MTGIPTTYRGTQFRSRVEARWAVMFDELGWRWEYEPFDGAGYIPDFVLMGADPVVVEVKADSTAGELLRHCGKVEAGLEGRWDHDYLIVGSSPFPFVEKVWTDRHGESEPTLGILGERIESEWVADLALWNVCGLCNLTTFRHHYQSFRCRICGHYDGDGYLGLDAMFDFRIDAAWAEASNATQWQPNGRPYIGPNVDIRSLGNLMRGTK